MSYFLKNQKKVINAWAMYDWANSAFFLVIATTIFPVYFEHNTPKVINLLGMELSNSALYSYIIALTYLILAFITPILSGIADYGGRRKYFLRMFVTFGSIACMGLFFFENADKMWIGVAAFMFSTIGCAGSLVFYDAYIPIIATKDKYDNVSARGYAFGFIGSVILLLFILSMIMKPELYGITDPSLPSRIGFVLVGLWWIGFSQITFKHLPKDNRLKDVEDLVKKGNQEVQKVYHEIREDKSMVNYLLSFFFFSAGVQTVIYVASIFASQVLKFEPNELIFLILIIQVVAIFGAYLMSFLSKKMGNKNTMMMQIVIWVGICLVASQVSDKSVFYAVAGFVGMVIGGIQSLARSSYSKMIPREEDLTSYYSFMDILYKLSIVVGTFAFGFVDNLTGDMRNSVIVLAIFFVIGLLFMSRVEKNRINS